MQLGTATRTGFTALGVAIGIAITPVASVHGSGFALIENSAQGQGAAYAGAAAVASDASTVWFNPAGMTRIEGTQVQAVGHIIAPTYEFTDGGSFQATPAGVLPLLPGAKRSNDGGTVGLVPNLYFVRDLGDRWKVGVGLNVPFGLKTEYDRNWVGRFQAVESEIRTFNLNPSIAYQVTPGLSVGAGVNIMYMDATLTNAVDFDAVCASNAPAAAAAGGVPAPAIPAAAAAACTGLPGSGTNAGFVENEADDVGFGANFGLLYQPSRNTRFGIAYRTEVSHELEGDANFTVPQGIGAGALGAGVQAGINAAFIDQPITADVDLPATFSVGAYHRFHPKFAVMGDVTWTGWDAVEELRIKFSRGLPDGVETLRWENTFRYGLGFEYYHDDKLTLRAGGAYDESPVPSLTMRTARLPGNDRRWVSLGASYAPSDRLTVDVGYTHLLINDTNIRRTGSSGNVLVGTYEADANIFSAQARYRWD